MQCFSMRCGVFTRALLALFLVTFSSFVWAQNKPSESKPGSVLVFPYYTSNDAGTADTLINISNLGTGWTVAHLYFIDSQTCTQADTSVYLSPNATFSMKSSDFAPFETGYLIVVGVSQSGCVTANGMLTGSAFVQAPAGYFGTGTGETRGNYSALAFAAYTTICPSGGTLALNFNGAALDAMPTGFAASVQNPTTAPGQTIILAGLNGNVDDASQLGGAQSGTAGAYSANETFRSFSAFLLGTCFGKATITNSQPRVSGFSTLGIGGLITPGSVGVIRFNTVGSAGILITPRNNSGWSGIRSLTCTRTSAVTLIVPAL